MVIIPGNLAIAHRKIYLAKVESAFPLISALGDGVSLSPEVELATASITTERGLLRGHIAP